MSSLKYKLKGIIIPYKLDGLLNNLLVLLPRVISGILLCFVYAPQNIGTPWSPEDLNLQLLKINPTFVGHVRDFGPPFDLMPLVFSWSAIITMAFGGFLMILGLNTRITSFFLVMTMFITILFREWDNSWSILPTFLFFCTGLFYLGFGSGKFGLDYYISKHYL
ncbi:DoxX family protein [Maribacter sp. CXY002]|uniref:DoxX family protein n=1 Tax=Maribacter luteocoastalis TaxID=3407671 RepID=UPI003B67F81A